MQVANRGIDMRLRLAREREKTIHSHFGKGGLRGILKINVSIH
jgi:hypothetical protein